MLAPSPVKTAADYDMNHLNTLLSKTKLKLFTSGKGAGFLGSLMCNHEYKWDFGHKTAWCNGVTIGFSPDFFLKLVPATRLTLLAHELWHTGMNHMGRMGDRDPKIWNIAADFVINGMLDKAGFSFENMNPCLDHQYDGMTTEQVYDLLMADATKVPAHALTGAPMSGEGASLGNDICPTPDGKETDVMATIVQAKQAAQMSNEAGSIPGEISQMIEEFLNPILPWEVLLYRYFSERSLDDYSWRRPSRRHEDVYLPSMIGDNGLEHIVHFWDISGSVTNEQVIRFNSELRYIHQELRPERLTLVTFDTKIQDIYEMHADDEYQTIEIHGRGGTSLTQVHDYIKEHRPTASVIFSDLCCTPMEDPGSPVLWVIVDNAGTTPEFGTSIHIREDQL